MKNKLFRLLSVLVVLVLMLSLSTAVLAEDDADKGVGDETEESAPVLTTGEDTEGDTVGATESENDVATDGATESATDGAADESAAESAAAETSQTETSQPVEEEDGSWAVKHLPRWITLGVIIILIVVAIILAKTKTKLGQKISKFFKDYKSEISKISWYSFKDTIKATGVVLVFLIALAAVIGLLDFLFTQGIKLLAGLF